MTNNATPQTSNDFQQFDWDFDCTGEYKVYLGSKCDIRVKEGESLNYKRETDGQQKWHWQKDIK